MGVGHQLADHQFGGEDQVFEVAARQLAFRQ
jgi:hypothetical protein